MRLLLALLITGASVKATAQTSLNVTNFGARGDAVQFYVNTVSNSVVVTTTNALSANDIGKTIEVFTVGDQTYGRDSYGVTNYGNQDLIASITNVVNGTNLYLSRIPQATRLNAWGTYGTDNTRAFSNTIAAAAGFATATITIPNGTYLLMPTWQTAGGYQFGSILIYRGGLRFVGESQVNTVLLSRGAWQLFTNPATGNAFCARGYLIQIVAPITNDLPLTFENMTWDGGVKQGDTDVHHFPANKIDGGGWDEKHGAYLTYDRGNNTGTATRQVLSNLTVIHWRGEMIKSIDGNRNGNIAIKNCLFADGNATALNVYPSWDVRNNIFSNLFQIAELYQQYYTNTSYFCNNFATNIFGNGFAINGGVWAAKPFVMQSNTFHLNGLGNHGILTLPAANISFLDNTFYCADYMQVFSVGAQGAQGSQCNSNILISGNRIYAQSKLTRVFGMGGSGINAVIGLTVCSNYVSAPAQIFDVTTVGGESFDLRFYNNTIESGLTELQTGIPGSTNAPFLLVESNNSYQAWPTSITTVQTNTISYSTGPKHRMDNVVSGNVFVLNDSEANQIPAGAYLQLDNSANRAGGGIRVYPSQSLGTSVLIPTGKVATFLWTNSAWRVASTIPSPRNLRVLGPGP